MAWSEDKKASTLAILQLNGGNVLQTSRDTGVPEATIRYWLKEGISKNPEVAEAVVKSCEGKKQEMADYLEELAWELAAGIRDKAKIKKAGLSQSATAFGIVVDKMRLLRGESTSINEVRESELRESIQRKFAKTIQPGAEA